MAKSKYESHVLPRFKEIESWVKQGATDEDIFKRLGIGKQTFYDYKKRYADFADLLKKNYEYCTDQVENALFEKAMKGDVVAQIFWLKNRRPDKWRDKPEVENKKDDSTEKAQFTKKARLFLVIKFCHLHNKFRTSLNFALKSVDKFIK